jgi:hypothetical protein
MLIKVTEQTSNKLVLKVKSSSILTGLLALLIGGGFSFITLLGILSSIKEILSDSSSETKENSFLRLVCCLLFLILGIFLCLGAILDFMDTTYTFDKNLRRLIIKNPKGLIPKFLPRQYSFNKIADVTTAVASRDSESSYNEFYKLSIVLLSNTAIVISEGDKIPRVREEQEQIVNLIKSYLS